MKIAVAAMGGLVDELPDRSGEYMVFSAGFGGRLTQEPSVASADGHGSSAGVAAELRRAGVTHLVVGRMDAGAAAALAERGIAVVRGASGDARAAAEALARGRLVDRGD
jgi:predicted Fe-Mo cluster-binding NifX family protein